MKELVLQFARDLGFDACGVVPAQKSQREEYFRDWISKGFQGDMAWMTRQIEKRIDPRMILPSARTIIVCAVNYFQYDLPPEVVSDPSRGIFARYAWFPDYHDIVGGRLARLAEQLEHLIHASGDKTRYRYKWYVDTGPVFEREVAERAGLGFIGNNTMLINTGVGSYVFLGVIVTDIDIIETFLDRGRYFFRGQTRLPRQQMSRNRLDGASDLKRSSPVETVSDSARFQKIHSPLSSAIDRVGGKKGSEQGGCFKCTRCMQKCPTGAIEGPHILNATKCISYLTIEHKGSIPEKLRSLMGNRVYGCDVCQEVCPWNKSRARKTNDMFAVNIDWVAPKLIDLIQLDEISFRERFKKSPVKRAKRRGLLRNVSVALGNWGSREAIPYLERAVRDHEPLIREHAQWAIDRIRCQN